jgi:hypothetical protein
MRSERGRLLGGWGFATGDATVETDVTRVTASTRRSEIRRVSFEGQARQCRQPSGSVRPSPRAGTRCCALGTGNRSATTSIASVPTTATGSWTIYRWGWQFTGSETLDEAHVSFFGAFGAAWDDAMVARWSASPLGILWAEMDAGFVTSGGSSPVTSRRPVVVLAGG